MPRYAATLALCFVCEMSIAATGEEYFEKEVRPLLHEKCSACHGEKMQQAGIDFRDPATVLGTAAIGGDESSPLIRAVRYESPVKMPPGTKLGDDEIEALVDWVRMGAPWPGYEPAAARGSTEDEQLVESDHWSFQLVSNPHVPDPGPSDWVRNDIDRFVLAKLRVAGLEPSPEAAKLVLLRRAKFDLHGLPPTEGEAQEFVEDSGGEAFRDLVERLLGSPHYGERWGRHWLDVARYADSTGVDEDHPFGDSWRYRDYVVRAFNDDLPFNRFVREQISGDLLPAAGGDPVNKRGVVATGFLALGPMALAQRDPVQKRYDVVDEQIDTTAKAFLGLTVACARCHDHKFDPILTSDYYALAGIFASTRTFDDWTRNGSRYYKHPLVERGVYEKYRAQADELERLELVGQVAARAALQRLLAGRPASRVADFMLAADGAGEPGDLDSETVDWYRDYLASRPSRRPHLARWHGAGEMRAAVAAEYAAEVRQAFEEQAGRLDAWIVQALRALEGEAELEFPEFPRERPASQLYRDLTDEGPLDMEPDDMRDGFGNADLARLAGIERDTSRLRGGLSPEPPMANAVTEGDPVRQRIFRRGQHKSPGAAVPKRFPLALAGPDQAPIESGSGRLELADWIASDRNPLTARVIANRVWLWHFGEGLVRTPNNFGLRGEEPTHPELLDWLARRLVESGWSIKAMHRLIMDSATYRMSSSIRPEVQAKDPENRLWSRFERRRLSVEELRDSYLQISGRLDPGVGGDTDRDSGKLKEFDRNNRRIDPDASTRRSLYLPLMRNKLPNLLGLFDFGDATTSGGQRSVTNVAPQALYLMNSGFAQAAAEGVAERLGESGPGRLEKAYRLVLSREPTGAEREAATAYLRSRTDERSAWASLCKMLLASNEFHYVE